MRSCLSFLGKSFQPDREASARRLTCAKRERGAGKEKELVTIPPSGEEYSVAPPALMAGATIGAAVSTWGAMRYALSGPRFAAHRRNKAQIRSVITLAGGAIARCSLRCGQPRLALGGPLGPGLRQAAFCASRQRAWLRQRGDPRPLLATKYN